MARTYRTELDYLRGRIHQEDHLAKTAASAQVGAAHASLALAYRRRMQVPTFGG